MLVVATTRQKFGHLGSTIVVNLHMVEGWRLWRARLARAYNIPGV